MNEKFIKNLISNDRIGSPDRTIEDRLDQAFLNKSASYRVKQNSFADFLVWIFSFKSMAIKTTLASILAAFFLFNPEIGIDSGSPRQLDSLRVSKNLQVDSTLFLLNSKNVKDSILL